MNRELCGSCLCGSVRFAVRGPFDRFRLCYCSRCRKATGSAHASNLFADADSFRWMAGEELVTQYKLETARLFSRSFCSRCGSAVPRTGRRDGMIVIPAGTLDDEPEIRPTHRIFCADQAEWSRNVDSVPAFARSAEP